MKTRDDIIRACTALGECYEDYPFDDPNWTLMRHNGSRRTFAFIFERMGNIWVNVKATKEGCYILREMFESVVPAYHMNKQNWVSIVLDGKMSDEDIMNLIRTSYCLTDTKRKTSKL